MVIKLAENTYRYIIDNNYIDFKLYCNDFPNDQLLLSNDISKDNVLLISKVYPTTSFEDPIIADAYKFENNKCIKISLVSAKILDTNLNFVNAKEFLSNLTF